MIIQHDKISACQPAPGAYGGDACRSGARATTNFGLAQILARCANESSSRLIRLELFVARVRLERAEMAAKESASRAGHAGPDIFRPSLTRLTLAGCGAKSRRVRLPSNTVMAARPLPQGLGLQDDRCPSVKDSLRSRKRLSDRELRILHPFAGPSHSNLFTGVTVPVAPYCPLPFAVSFLTCATP